MQDSLLCEALTNRGQTMKNIAYVLSLLMLTLMTACSDRKEYVIAMSQCSEDIWREKLNTEMLAGTYLYDNVTLRVASANDDNVRQTEQINGFVNDGVDILIVAPNQMNTVTPAIENAYNKGIPVILFDRKTGSDKYTAFIGADNVKMGRTMGEYIASRLGGKGRVLEITGLKGSSPAIERHQGFADALKHYPGIELVAVSSGTWMQQSGRKAMEAMLDSVGGNIDYVFAHNDRMALGARQAAQARGLAGRIKFIGIDALPGKGGGIELVRDGVLDASYIYPTRGDMVMQLAMSILEKHPYQRENLMKTALVTKDNAEVLLMQAEEMNKLNDKLNMMHDRVNMYLTQYSHQKVYLMMFIIILVLLVLSFVAFYRTIVVKRRMREDAANAKLVFFTNISHEFRTPLTLIADPVRRMLEADNLTTQQRSMLCLVRKNVDVMLRLVGEILDLRKIQNGKMQLTVSRFNLSDSVGQWVANFAPLADSRDVDLSVDCGHDINIEADLYKMERICYNLISNAIKYNRKGGRVRISLAADGGMARLTVSDTGIGIPRDKINHVFDRFFQASAENRGGTGIGLAIVKAFVDLHHGQVTAEANADGGATFTVSLSLTQPGETIVEQPDAAALETGDSVPADIPMSGGVEMMTAQDDGERKSIVVVDDNSDVKDYIVSLLSAHYDVKCASDGREGLALCVKYVPDLVICDVMMPVMDGLEMCRRLKAETATSHVPVILLTARTFDDQRAEGYDCGADAYITKPFSSNVLLSRVRNLLNERMKLKNIYSGAETEEDKAADDPDTRFVADFRHRLKEHLSDSELNVETLAAELGLSRVQLYRKVKQLTGSSPVEIIRITRLKAAEQLLRTTSKTVSEISYDVGFSSPSYFTKCFKDYFGHLPNEGRGV